MPHRIRCGPQPALRSPESRRAVVLTSYMTGAPGGKNLTAPGYSYDFVARAFAPLLKQWGEVIEVPRPERRLDAEVNRARSRNLQPVHVSFRAFQHACLARSAPNLIVPALEFPDVPDQQFDADPRSNWVRMANQCAALIVSGPFTKSTLIAAGVRTPIRIVPVPIPEACFRVPVWRPCRRRVLDVPGYVLPVSQESPPATVLFQRWELAAEGSCTARKSASLGTSLWGACGRLVRPCLPARLEEALAAAVRAGIATWRVPYPDYPKSPWVDLSGIVYTSIFAPADVRKNWEDLLTGFLLALGDRDDATLVLKLITRKPSARNAVLAHYRRLDIPHRCKVVVITDFLSEQQMLALMEASTYYVTTTRAEGNCLPLRNYLAAGRPGITPSHTAIADYFGSDLGYVVDSHPEPTDWLHDGRSGCRTTWHRLVWPSLVEQIRSSYWLAKQDRHGYEQLSYAASEKMWESASAQRVLPQLFSALESTAAGCEDQPSDRADSPAAAA